jgi:DNA repair protein RadC
MNNPYTFRTAISEALCIKESSVVVQELVSKFNTPFDLMDATEQELISIKGIGPMRAKQIQSTLKIARLLNMPKEAPKFIRSPRDVFDIFRHTIGVLNVEEFHIIMLSTKNGIIGTEMISRGTLNSSLVHPRETFIPAIRRSASSIIAIHNHPSGDCTPSPEDVQLTKRLMDCGELLGIPCLDHVIISKDSFGSLKERDLI